ncbi:uncharacterized protein [Venturia canescens]|uniref:uncharacterized protein n=1 Tax=Venturia canescens TaxID=32260 RepID=UPI001C9C4027|nr:uncharacterized protein LOC122409327 [Venturia canescens]XP_043272736.1 uncharacterized protein LOC122409327 [Venturia canescens]XP_043272737.1 uncharacterized protein LOC122409327 [Venturia canescens]XP_043272738.1 uncharacterized protein LOC122409327 [Venturia canescens]XP_043272739.1 uncharacterized protein LOC122409327 [Venturia canescens]XP_043272740.1 uncharacterized protein LOC122409327 [Venturia canescens]XP_043272741.1 uncharacterized protein LOC122409327 [Venturia canescens]XP_0
MTEPGFRRIIVLFLLSLVGDLVAVTIVDRNPDDDDILEHQVTYADALAQAKNLKIYPGTIPGCKECTSSEMTYCRDESVLADHCCCDGSYNKVFPFVEHICRLSRQPCKVIAADCAEYTRLRECCCHSYLASVWKYMAGGAPTTASSLTAIVGALTVLQLVRRLL